MLTFNSLAMNFNCSLWAQSDLPLRRAWKPNKQGMGTM